VGLSALVILFDLKNHFEAHCSSRENPSLKHSFFTMYSIMQYLSIFVVLGVTGASILPENPFDKLARRELVAPRNSLEVDLGYEIYAGVANSTTKINSFKG
jgi:hypothetical protein